MKKNTSVFARLLNFLYFTVVVIAAFSVSSLALARQVNTYQATKQPILFTVDKEDIVIATAVSGRIEEVLVHSGQHVKKDDLLVKISDESLTAKLDTLESVADENLSARTEANLLKSQQTLYEIRAPRDGVVYKIHAGEGAYLNTNTEIATLFADSNVKITGLVYTDQYAKIQKSKNVDLYSPRFQQIYSVTLEGVGRVIPATQYEGSRYELQFRFTDANEGAAFIEGEGLEVLNTVQADTAIRPAERLTQFWNMFIIGK